MKRSDSKAALGIDEARQVRTPAPTPPSQASITHREDAKDQGQTFPLKLGLSATHHNLSHATDKEGQMQFAKYDLFLSRHLYTSAAADERTR